MGGDDKTANTRAVIERTPAGRIYIAKADDAKTAMGQGESGCVTAVAIPPASATVR
jgi:hypothetical protein